MPIVMALLALVLSTASGCPLLITFFKADHIINYCYFQNAINGEAHVCRRTAETQTSAFTGCRHFIYKDRHYTTAACTATDHVLLTEQFQYNQTLAQSLKAFSAFLTQVYHQHYDFVSYITYSNVPSLKRILPDPKITLWIDQMDNLVSGAVSRGTSPGLRTLFQATLEKHSPYSKELTIYTRLLGHFSICPRGVKCE